jgi:hypothetical protein
MLRKSVVLAFAFALVLGAAAPASALETLDGFQHEGWAGEAVFQDGQFRQCHMWMPEINNWDLGLSLDASGELRLGLRTRDIDQFWQMLFGQKTALRIQVDRGPVLIKAFQSVTPKLVSTSLKGTDWDKRLPNGTLFRVNPVGRVKLFHLTGIREAMGMLRKCAAKHGMV